MTYRDRRLAKADRLELWADANDTKSDDAHDTARAATEHIPFGQPILVGHHSERRHRNDLERAHRNMDKAVALAAKADDQRSRAANIRAQADAAIYDDDPDAIERLTAKLADLEAERERIKAHNRAARKAKCYCPDDCACHSQWRPTVCGCTNHALPSYHLQNLGGNITRTRQRLARLTARAERTGTTAKPPRRLALKYAGTCGTCGTDLAAGTTAYYDRASRTVTCTPCHEGEPPA